MRKKLTLTPEMKQELDKISLQILEQNPLGYKSISHPFTQQAIDEIIKLFPSHRLVDVLKYRPVANALMAVLIQLSRDFHKVTVTKPKCKNCGDGYITIDNSKLMKIKEKCICSLEFKLT